MAEESFQERTEKPTSRRRRKAREQGKVAKSMELNSAAILCLGFLSLYMMGPHLARQTMQIMAYTLANAPQIAMADPTFVSVFGDYMVKFFLVLSPVFVLVTLVAIGINVAQVGFKITPKAMELKFDKLNMANGLKRLVSVRSLVQLVRDSIKLLIIGFVAYKVIQGEFKSFFLLPDMSVAQFASQMGKLALQLTLKVGAVIFVIAALDYMYQRYEFEKSIRMSKQDLKDEYKETEGSPQLKSRVRQMQREMARSRMMQDVPKADVVVTNPTEIAVALKYDPEEMDAPYVLAMGERLVAQRIKELARECGIPVVEDKPLARALFRMCDVGQVVPTTLYKAVAEVLAYVYKMKGKVVG
ncbi:MAG: flagellar biosynthesis protein FlhB [Candidatus Zixiibacteriota bacterium]|nr:MAG: flagellar biosynthesis protein FlhB [candidate division Zixibacteria bacterium]